MAPWNPRSRSRTSSSEARTDEGGLLIAGADGEPIHVVPPEVSASLRFFVTRMQTSERLGDRRTIAVTSALAGEGVTFTALSLAAITAHDLRRSVCVVETNWWKKSHRRNRVADEPNQPGLAEILEGGADIDDVILPTNDALLSILPSGNTPMALRPMIVASDEFAALLDEIASRFDTVVIDVPPVLRASEAITICGHADAAILVVHQGVTPERVVAKAVEELRGVDILGVVLNRSASSIPRLLQALTVPT